MIVTPKLKTLLLKKVVGYVENHGTLNSSMWSFVARDISADYYNISNLRAKEIFYKEVLPTIEFDNFGLSEDTLRKIRNLRHSSIALSPVSNDESNPSNRLIISSVSSLWQRPINPTCSTPNQSSRKFPSSIRDIADFNHECSLNIDDVGKPESQTDTTTNSWDIRISDHHHVANAGSLHPQNAELSFDLPDYNYDSLETSPEDEKIEGKTANIINDQLLEIELPDSDYDEFEISSESIESEEKPLENNQKNFVQADAGCTELDAHKLPTETSDMEHERTDSGCRADSPVPEVRTAGISEERVPEGQESGSNCPAKTSAGTWIVNFELPDSDYEEFEISGNKKNVEKALDHNDKKVAEAHGGFNPRTRQNRRFHVTIDIDAEIVILDDESDSSFEEAETDFNRNVQFTSTQVFPVERPSPAVAAQISQQCVPEAQEADSSIQEKEPTVAWKVDFRLASSDLDDTDKSADRDFHVTRKKRVKEADSNSAKKTLPAAWIANFELPSSDNSDISDDDSPGIFIIKRKKCK